MFKRIKNLIVLILSISICSTKATGGMPAADPRTLSFIEAQFDIGLRGAGSVAFSPSWLHIYVVRYEDNTVAVFHAGFNHFLPVVS